MRTQLTIPQKPRDTIIAAQMQTLSFLPFQTEFVYLLSNFAFYDTDEYSHLGKKTVTNLLSYINLLTRSYIE